MTPTRAAELLAVPESADALQVQQAYRAAVKQAHPDTGPANGVSIKDLQMARDVLIERVVMQNNACRLCDGVGKVRGVMGWRECSACDGKGERQ